MCFVGGDLFSLDYICGYQYELLNGQFVYGLYSFAWTEQVRPLQASYLKNGSLTEVRTLQASLIITPHALLGDVFSLDYLRWVPRSPPTKHKAMWLEVLVVVSLHPVTQISSKVCAVVSPVLSRQNCTKHRHTDLLGEHIDTHRRDLMRKDHPNKAQSGMVWGACSGLTSSCDPDFK